MESGSSGCAVRFSMATKMMSRIAETAKRPMRRGREPVVLVGLDERVDQQREGRGHDDRAGHVEVARGTLDTALAQQPRRQRDRDETDRHVDVEDPLPAEVLGEDSSEQHPDGAAGARHGTPDGEGLVALDALGERRRQDRERGRRDERGAEPLHRARADQDPAGRREAAGERRCDEDEQPDHEHATAPEQVGSASTEQQEAAEREGVPARNPLQVRGREVERLLDRREGDVDDRDVDDEHELRRAQESERDPAAGVRSRGHDSFRTARWRTVFLDVASGGYARRAIPASRARATEGARGGRPCCTGDVPARRGRPSKAEQTGFGARPARLRPGGGAGRVNRVVPNVVTRPRSDLHFPRAPSNRRVRPGSGAAGSAVPTRRAPRRRHGRRERPSAEGRSSALPRPPRTS